MRSDSRNSASSIAIAAAAAKVVSFIRGDSTAIAREGTAELLPAAGARFFGGTGGPEHRFSVAPRDKHFRDGTAQVSRFIRSKLERPEIQSFQHGRWRNFDDANSN